MNRTEPPGGGGPSVRLLVSVKSVDEALLAARGGADFIDLKEPGRGALGGLPIATIRAIVAALREQGCARPVSATIGDWPVGSQAGILAAVAAVGGCGVDYVKVGIAHRSTAPTADEPPHAVAPPRPGVAVGPLPGSTAAAALLLLRALAAAAWPVVPVFIGDDGVDAAAVALACRLRAERGPGCFPAMMIDTQDKRRGSLFDRVPADVLRRFVTDVRGAGALAGLAGALRLADLPALAAQAPDFAGFRSAVCAGDRAGALDPALLASLSASLLAVLPSGVAIGTESVTPVAAG